MKLASLKTTPADGAAHGHGRDGRLVVVSRDLARYAEVADIAPTLQSALDDWAHAAPRLKQVYEALNRGTLHGHTFDPHQAAAPLPRAHHWVDGSAYVTHVELVRKARGAELPPQFWTDPLVYQGGSDDFLGAMDEAHFADEAWGIDLEAEVAVITGDVPFGTLAEDARKRGDIRLLMLVNDWSLRNLIPDELAKGFGFYQSKPATAFSPVAVTPDELGKAWDGGKLHLPLVSHLNGHLLGKPDAGKDMTFDFNRLIEHVTKTRRLGPGTVIGSGTVANADRKSGSSCLAEKRALEMIEHGKPKTQFLKFGDRVRIEMLDAQGHSIFGALDQRVARTPEA